jgi:hypothetical protein
MKNKILIVMFAWMTFWTGVFLVQSCAIDCETKGIRYQLIQLFSSAKRITGTHSYSNSTMVPDYIVEDLAAFKGVRYDSLVLEIRHDLGRISMSEVGNFGHAVACDPSVEYESLSDLSITSNQNYADGYPAGTNLKNIVAVHPNYTTAPYDTELFIDQGQIGPVNILLKFKSPPAENALHTFVVTYSIEGGGQFSTTLADVMVTK